WQPRTARCSPPWPCKSPWPSPSMFNFPILRRPWTASFHTAVYTVLPFHSISRGRPTFPESSCAIQTLIVELPRGTFQIDALADGNVLICATPGRHRHGFVAERTDGRPRAVRTVQVKIQKSCRLDTARITNISSSRTMSEPLE